MYGYKTFNIRSIRKFNKNYLLTIFKNYKLYSLLYINYFQKILNFKLLKNLSLLFLISININLINFNETSANIIRDTEIEEAIRTWSNPIFEAAGLNKTSINIYIIADPAINAFVSNGQNIYINTGLIFKSSSASGLAGVIAHETGHIAAGHIVRTMEKMRDLEKEQIITTLLGIGSFILGTKNSDLIRDKSGFGRAMLSISPDLTRRNFFSYTRMNEHAADSLAIKYLKKVNRNPGSLLLLLNKLYGQELLLFEKQEPFLRTHPLTKSRMQQIKNQVPYNTRFIDNPMDIVLYKRIVAKLEGFLENPGKVSLEYPAEDTTIFAKYARSIAYYKVPQLYKAVYELDKLLLEYPHDPYFHELKGQILYENGHVLDSINSYDKAIKLKPNSPLIHLAAAAARIETNKEKYINTALDELNLVLLKEPDNIMAWNLKGIAHNRRGEYSLSQIAAAEVAIRKGDKAQAKIFIDRARKNLKTNSPADLQAQDIIKYINKSN